jgi:hypothetical protein
MEQLVVNITPEVERLLEVLASGVATRVQGNLGKELPTGLPSALQEIVVSAALISLAEAYTKTLAAERLPIAARIAVRIVDTSEKLKAEHARGAGGFIDALRKAGLPVEVVPVGAGKPPEAH